MAQVNIRIDDVLKEQADSLFEELGMNISTAVNVFIRQTVRERKIPFSIAAEPEPLYGYGEDDKTDPFYSEENMKWLRESIEQGKQGKYIVKTIEELEAMTNG